MQGRGGDALAARCSVDYNQLGSAGASALGEALRVNAALAMLTCACTPICAHVSGTHVRACVCARYMCATDRERRRRVCGDAVTRR